MFPSYLDPNAFLDQFPSDSTSNPSGWSDAGYGSELEAANAILSRPERMKALAACENSTAESNAVPAVVPLLVWLSVQALRSWARKPPTIRHPRVQVCLDRHELEAIMIGRRALLGFAPAAMFSCSRSTGAYFGKTALPQSRKLVHTLGGEMESLDPAKSTGSWEYYVIPALFEGLVISIPNVPSR